MPARNPRTATVAIITTQIRDGFELMKKLLYLLVIHALRILRANRKKRKKDDEGMGLGIEYPCSRGSPLS